MTRSGVNISHNSPERFGGTTGVAICWVVGASERPVPKYFFHVHDGQEFPDDEGTDLADDNVARAEAVILSGEILRDLAGNFWNFEDWRLVVMVEDGREVCHLTITAAAPEAS
jgi:hypothetical protein